MSALANRSGSIPPCDSHHWQNAAATSGVWVRISTPYSVEHKGREQERLLKKPTKWVGVLALWITILLFTACSHHPSLTEQVQAAYDRRNASYDRLVAKIKRLPPEQRIQEYDRLEKYLEEERRERAQEDLTNAIQDLADATRGY